MLARGLLTLSSAVLAVTGLAYLLVPGLALAIVGIESSPDSDFLLRTEGVALLFGAAVVGCCAAEMPGRIGSDSSRSRATTSAARSWT